MAVGDKTIDPVTGEPEIELADGSRVTDWDALAASFNLDDLIAPADQVDGNYFKFESGKLVKADPVELTNLPTSVAIQSVSGNQTGNGFVANAVYRSNNTGPLQNTGFGNWTWRVRATRIGDWIQHMYWNDTGNIAFRESFNGGASWSTWAA